MRGQRVQPNKVERAKELRREMTPAESVLWERVRGNRLGFHFRRQQILRGFIADFYCHAAAIVVELDGSVHDERQEGDAHRTAVFADMRIEVLRFRNEEVTDNIADVVERIVSVCRRRVACGEEPNPPAPFPGKEGGEKTQEDGNATDTPGGVRPSPPGGGAASGASGEGFRV